MSNENLDRLLAAASDFDASDLHLVGSGNWSCQCS